MSKKSTGSTTRTDLTRLQAMKDSDIAHDEDNPRTTAEDWNGAVMKVGGRVIGRTRGKQKAPTKIAKTIRYSEDVIEQFQATGPGWQTRVDLALRDWLKHHNPAEIKP